MVKILSWNTLESGEGGAWSNGWGCPLEIQRRESLIPAIMKDGNYTEAKQKAERMLTQQRYKRIRQTLLEEFRHQDEPIDFLLFQECTVGDFWDDPSNLDPSYADSIDYEFFNLFQKLYQKVPCVDAVNFNDGDTVQHVYLRRDSGWKPTISASLRSEAFVGGCLAQFIEECADSCKNPSKLVLVNIHGKAGTMRDNDKLRLSVLDLLDEIGSHFSDDDWQKHTVLCGDWNTQLTDLDEPFCEAGYAPGIGMLDNTTATTDYPFFSTNHEAGFLAQYDGCLMFGEDADLQLEETSWNMTGFMPKGLDGKLSGDNPDAIMYNNFTYGSENNYEGVYLNGTFLPGTKASTGLSDHLRIYTKVRIDDKKKESAISMQSPLDIHQRRPYRDYDEEAKNDSGTKGLRG